MKFNIDNSGAGFGRKRGYSAEQIARVVDGYRAEAALARAKHEALEQYLLGGRQ